MLSPLLALVAALCGVMVWGAFSPSHRLHWSIAVAGQMIALAALSVAARHDNTRISSLLLFDSTTIFFSAMILMAGLVVTLVSWRYLSPRCVHGEDHHREYYLLLLLAIAGALILVASRHFAALFLGMEIMSLSLFGLVAYAAHDRRGLEAGLKYLLLSASSSALLLFGLALIYGATGTLGFDAPVLAQNVSMERAGILLAVVGFAFKLSLVPFHMWTPDVFEGAPAPVTALIAAVSKGAVAAAFLKFLSQNALGHDAIVSTALGTLAILSMLVGNLLALFQTNIKRLLAYSSIGHMGFLLVPFAAGGALLGEAAVYYIVAYVAASLAAFAVVAYLSAGGLDEQEDLEHYRGVAWRQPLAATVLGFALLSLAGIPLTVGFIGKLYLFAAGVEAARWGLVAMVFIGSAIAIYYYVRVITILFAATGKPTLLPGGGRGVLLFLLLFILFYGALPAPLIQAVRAAVLPLR